MKRVLFAPLALLILTLAAAPVRAASLTLTIHDGKVSLNAQDVTIRQILTEWARVGKTTITNLERVTSAPVTLQFEGVPENQALDIVLRSLPGYMAALRATITPDASIYDRILIMATTVAVAPRPAGSAAPPGGAPFPPFPRGNNVTQLRPGLVPEQGDNDDPDPNDPAIAAAAAAGLVAVPAPAPGVSDPTLRVPATTLRAPARAPAVTPGATPANSGPTPMWTAPVGTAQPSAPTPVPAQPGRPAVIAPPQPDR